MRVGVDGKKIPRAKQSGPLGILDNAVSMGMSGVFFRTVLDISPTLDRGLLRSLRARADELGLYLECGLGNVNPYVIPETPELRAIGRWRHEARLREDDRCLCRYWCMELWAGTGNHKPYDGYFAYDRFRTDTTWGDQLVATGKLLNALAPIARHHGVHINLETHEEITSFELVRLVEAVGPDALGIVYDTSNLLQRGEHPLAVTRRIAGYVRQTHMKNAALAFGRGGVLVQGRAVGQGVIDLRAILSLLAQASPGLTLSIENRQPDEEARETYPTFGARGSRPGAAHLIEVFDPIWLDAHPDLSVHELAQYLELVQESDRMMRDGLLSPMEAIESAPLGTKKL